MGLWSLQVPVASWFDDMSDTELIDLVPFFEALAKVDSVYSVLKNANVTTTNHNSEKDMYGMST